MTSINRALAQGASLTPIILRLIVGGYLLWHGLDKFDTGLSNVEGFFDAQGVPLPGLAAPFTAIAEVVIGIALIIGIGTRVAALAGIGIMVGALLFVHWTPVGESGFFAGSEVPIMYIAGLAGIMLNGPGSLSVDKMINADDTIVDLRTPARAATNA